MKYFLNKLLIFFLLSGAIATGSCSGEKKEKRVIDRKKLEESLIQANKQLLREESKEIEAFIEKKDWKMQTTGSGLRYMIYKEGQGDKIEKGEQVQLDYTLMLMNGDTVETSEEKGYQSFIAGKGDAIQGLHEMVLLMHRGDMAKVIIPSHLAWGLTGIPNKIPAKAVLVYDIKLQ